MLSTTYNKEIRNAFGVNCSITSDLSRVFENLAIQGPGETQKMNSMDARQIYELTIKHFNEDPHTILSGISEFNHRLITQIENGNLNLTEPQRREAMTSLKAINVFSGTPKAEKIIRDASDRLTRDARLLNSNFNLSGQVHRKIRSLNISVLAPVPVTEGGLTIPVIAENDVEIPTHLNISLRGIFADFINPLPKYESKEFDALPTNDQIETNDLKRKATNYKASAITAYLLSTILLANGLGTYTGVGPEAGEAVKIGVGGVSLLAGIAWQIAERSLVMDKDKNDGLNTLMWGLLIADAFTIGVGTGAHHEIIALLSHATKEVDLSIAEIVTTVSKLIGKSILAILGSGGAEWLDKRSHELGNEMYQIFKGHRRNGYPKPLGESPAPAPAPAPLPLSLTRPAPTYHPVGQPRPVGNDHQ